MLAKRDPEQRYNLYLSATAELPEHWYPYRWDASVGPDDFIKITGCEVHVIERGKNKGRPNWRKKVPGTTREYWIHLPTMNEWIKEWEARTGTCIECFNTGREWCGWSVYDGPKYRDCTHCKRKGVTETVQRDGAARVPTVGDCSPSTPPNQTGDNQAM